MLAAGPGRRPLYAEVRDDALQLIFADYGLRLAGRLTAEGLDLLGRHQFHAKRLRKPDDPDKHSLASTSSSSQVGTLTKK